MKKMRTMLLLSMLVLMISNTMCASADLASIPPSSQISADPNSSYCVIYFPVEKIPEGSKLSGEDGLSLIKVSSGISNRGSSSVSVSAETTANIACMSIGGIVRVQRWINNGWSTFCTYQYEAHGTSSSSFSQNVPVESGFYYRVLTSHSAITKYSGKYASSNTAGILIN